MAKKILYVIPRLAKAGTEKHLIVLALGLGKLDFEIHILCLFEIGLMPELPQDTRCKIFYLNRKNVYDLRAIYDIYKLIKKEKYDIVHVYLFGFQYLAVIPARLAKVKLILSSRREIAVWKRLHHWFLENLANIFTDKIVVCSKAVMDFVLKTEKISQEKIEMIYNGIDLEKFSPHPKNHKVLAEFGLTEEDKVIGMVANFSLPKNHICFLKAMQAVKERFPCIKALLIGDGPLRKKIEDAVGELGINQNIIFVGIRDDIPEILSVIDILVLPSLREGLPNAVLEAMACGLPVVASRVGGIPEAVEDGKSGILVPAGNHQAIAEALLKLLSDPCLRKELGERGRKIAETKFSLERMVEDYCKFYTG